MPGRPLVRVLVLALLGCVLALAVVGAAAQGGEGVVLIAHPSVPRLDPTQAKRLYTGRAVEVGSVSVTVFNAPPGSKARERFLSLVMGQDEARYTAYWTVRKHIGKGTPPRELPSAAEAIAHVQSSPGAIAYVLPADLRPGLNVVLVRP